MGKKWGKNGKKMGKKWGKNGKKMGKKQSLTVKVVGLGFNPEGDFFHVSADSCILLLGKNSFVDPFPILFVETEFRRVLESTV